MCGIIGYTGSGDAADIIFTALRALEYRGYDLSGIAAFDGREIRTVKAEGRISAAESRYRTSPFGTHCAIGHTRWATHGAPSDANAHPHTKGMVTLVHNGIIENHDKLRRDLSQLYYFSSDTDTETACALIDNEYSVCRDPVEAIFSATARLNGSYAFAILFSDRPGEIYAIRRDSPLIAGEGKDGFYIASDLPPLLGRCETFWRPENELCVLRPDRISFLSPSGVEKSPVPFDVTWSTDVAEKGAYSHFMLKEICEEPEVIHRTVLACSRDGIPDEFLPDCAISGIRIIACGTAMHAGLVGKHLIEGMAEIPVQVEAASEFRYNGARLAPDALVIPVSQSGETADTLAALRMSKAMGAHILPVVNVVGSSVARESKNVIYTLAGPEIAVASTKAYLAQLAVMYLLAVSLAVRNKKMTGDEARSVIQALSSAVPQAVAEIISRSDKIAAVARRYKDAGNAFFIGRGIDSLLCEEASLKLKEISYIHSEAYPAGELKHGAISLITPDVPTFAIITRSETAGKTQGNIREVRARGGRVAVIAAADIDCPPDLCDDLIRLPPLPELYAPFPAAAAFQLLAYHIAAARGCDIDKPRNLAKSVTVE